MIAVETPGFSSLMDHWKLPEGGSPASVTLVVSDKPLTGVRNAVVCTPGTDPPALYALDGGSKLYARVRRLHSVPDGEEPVAVLRAMDGSIWSYVTLNRANNVVSVPFVFDEAIQGFELERYTDELGGGIPPVALSAYYRAKKFIPRGLIREARSFAARRTDYGTRFPAWPFEDSLEYLRGFLLTLVLEVLGGRSLPFIWFWPEGNDSCLLLTHDVETHSGRDQIPRFMQLESELGLRSSYNLVPRDYDIPPTLIQTIHDGGCEVGVHGWTHDGLLFSDWDLFTERVEGMKRVARTWDAIGFRSPATHRNPDWFHAMGFDYDSSAPDSDPFEPQSGGCLSVFPFFVDDVLEIPITMPQDHTLFALLKERDHRAWDRKASLIVERHGLVCMLAHPDEMTGYAGNEHVMPIYRAFLEGLQASGNSLWNPLPRELSAWWRSRRGAGISMDTDGPRIVNGSDGMALGWLRLTDGGLVVEPPTS